MEARKVKSKSVTSAAVIITGVGFVIGLAEALLYYNLGKSAGSKFTYKIPPGRELMKTAATVLITSILTGYIASWIEGKLSDERQIA
jgi:uncharacterized membrane protein (DUF106 family)